MSRPLLHSTLIVVIFLFTYLNLIEGQVKKCYSCRSRGKLGDCRDPFVFNATNLNKDVEAIPCSSGWCSKEINGDEHGEDHDLATERRCMQRPPPDLKPRCAEALKQHRKIFICFCQGSLCNSAMTIHNGAFGVLLVFSYFFYTNVLFKNLHKT